MQPDTNRYLIRNNDLVSHLNVPDEQAYGLDYNILVHALGTEHHSYQWDL
jgi:hypothetical protein